MAAREAKQAVLARHGFPFLMFAHCILEVQLVLSTYTAGSGMGVNDLDTTRPAEVFGTR